MIIWRFLIHSDLDLMLWYYCFRLKPLLENFHGIYRKLNNFIIKIILDKFRFFLMKTLIKSSLIQLSTIIWKEITKKNYLILLWLDLVWNFVTFLVIKSVIPCMASTIFVLASYSKIRVENYRNSLNSIPQQKSTAGVHKIHLKLKKIRIFQIFDIFFWEKTIRIK